MLNSVTVNNATCTLLIILFHKPLSIARWFIFENTLQRIINGHVQNWISSFLNGTRSDVFLASKILNCFSKSQKTVKYFGLAKNILFKKYTSCKVIFTAWCNEKGYVHLTMVINNTVLSSWLYLVLTKWICMYQWLWNLCRQVFLDAFSRTGLILNQPWYYP